MTHRCVCVWGDMAPSAGTVAATVGHVEGDAAVLLSVLLSCAHHFGNGNLFFPFSLDAGSACSTDTEPQVVHSSHRFCAAAATRKL